LSDTNVDGPLTLSQPNGSALLELDGVSQAPDYTRIVIREDGFVQWIVYNNRTAHQTLMIMNNESHTSLSLDQNSDMMLGGTHLVLGSAASAYTIKRSDVTTNGSTTVIVGQASTMGNGGDVVIDAGSGSSGAVNAGAVAVGRASRTVRIGRASDSAGSLIIVTYELMSLINY